MATKKTLKIKNTSCLILKRDCFEVLAVSFQNSIKSFLLQVFPFLLLQSLSSSLLFFPFSYYLTLFSIQVLFYLGYYMIFCLSIILLFFCLFFFRLFISHFKFIFVPFSSFIFLFCRFLSFCASNESAIMSFICMLLFLDLSLLACCKSSEKNEKTIQTTEKTQVSFAFVVVLLQVLSWTINSDYFSPSSHPYHFKSHPTLSPVPS